MRASQSRSSASSSQSYEMTTADRGERDAGVNDDAGSFVSWVIERVGRVFGALQARVMAGDRLRLGRRDLERVNAREFRGGQMRKKEWKSWQDYPSYSRACKSMKQAMRKLVGDGPTPIYTWAPVGSIVYRQKECQSNLATGLSCHKTRGRKIARRTSEKKAAKVELGRRVRVQLSAVKLPEGGLPHPRIYSHVGDGENTDDH